MTLYYDYRSTLANAKWIFSNQLSSLDGNHFRVVGVIGGDLQGCGH